MRCKIKENEFERFILEELLRLMPSSSDSQKKDCIQFYELLCKLLEESEKNGNSKQKINYSEVMLKTIENYRSHFSTEHRSSISNDKMLTGFLNLIEKILTICPELGDIYGDFMMELFKTGLFDLSDQKERQFDSIMEKTEVKKRRRRGKKLYKM